MAYKGEENAKGEFRLLTPPMEERFACTIKRGGMGGYPVRAVLYFLNELKTKSGDPPITRRPVPAVHIVDFRRAGVEADGTPTLVKEDLNAFDLTADDIMALSSCWG